MIKRAIFDKKNVLITGGAGFIGSHLCDELVKNNKVICVDNFITGNEKNIDQFNLKTVCLNCRVGLGIDKSSWRESPIIPDF